MSSYSKGLPLHNSFDRNTLKEKLAENPKERMVLSFYRYVRQENLEALREELYSKWQACEVLGRVYIAAEGINAQISVPRDRFEEFHASLEAQYPNMILKHALENQLDSFLKLIVRIKKKIVADGLQDDTFDPSDVGKHLSAKEFNEAMNEDGTIVIDVRNHYESEIGHFKGAHLPDVCSFREELPVIRDSFSDKKDSKILLYCTGGIRCEKTSAWLKHNGFKDVNQLHGGIIDYVRQVKEEGLENKFIGKNFVFDERLGERVTPDIIAECHVCGTPADTHTNCSWQACHILLIMCEECKESLDGCCSVDCQEKTKLPFEEQKRLRKEAPQNPPGFFKGKRRPSRPIVRSNSSMI